MWTVRAVRIEDLDALHALIQSATRGLTSLQLDRNRLLDRVEQSVFAFTRTGRSHRAEPFVLVLANDQSGELVGTSTVYAKTGGHEPFYAYRIVRTDHHSEMLNIDTHYHCLELQKIHDGPTEIGSLFLRGTFRGAGRGRWLSIARFALIAMQRHRFGGEVIAEMRGRADPDGTVPFWEAIAGRFLPIDFAVADTMSTVSKSFIEDLMPEHPIYLDLLPEHVRAGIGQVHDETRPAIEMLKAQGFVETDLIDIFDGGPVIRCDTDRIRGVSETRKVTVTEITDSVPSSSPEMIIVSASGGFTSVRGQLVLRDNQLTLLADVANTLNVDIGSDCWILPLR